VINQQADLAADSGQGSVLARVVEESHRVMRQTQATWIKLIDTEFKKEVDKREDVRGGLAEYSIALANDQVKSADFTEALLGRLEPLVSEKYKAAIGEKLNDAMDGHLDVAKRCIQILIDLIFNDIKPAVKILFTSAWYSMDDGASGSGGGGGPMTQIIETIRDYMAVYQTRLNPTLFDLLIEDMIDTFLVTYLASLRRASKLRVPGAAERIRQDVRLSFAFFAAYKAPKELEAYFDVVDGVLKLVTASKTMFFLDYWPFAKRYGANLAYVEAVLKARDDLDKSQVRDIMDGLRKKVNDEALAEPPNPTIFSRLPAK
jgi:exocyst complex component 3